MSLVQIGRGMSLRAQNSKKIPTPLFAYDVDLGGTITDISEVLAGSLNAGTVFFSYIDTGAQTGLSSGKFILNVGNSNWSEAYAIYKEKDNGHLHCVVRSNGGYEIDNFLNAQTLPSHVVRVAISWGGGRVAFFINGQRFVMSDTHNIPSGLTDGVRFGSREGGLFPIIGETTVEEKKAAFWQQSLSDAQCIELTRLDAVKTYYSQDGSERVIDTNGVDWVSDMGGFMWAQMTINAEPTGNEYPLVLDSGNTTNVAGIRLYTGQPFHGYWLRGNVVNLGSTHIGSSGIPESVYGTRQTVGLSWNNITGEAYMYASGYTKTVDISAEQITQLSRLNIGARNGVNPLNGTLHQFEVGNEYISPIEMEKRIQSKVDRIVIVGAGQSLERGALISQETGSDVGYRSLILELNQMDNTKEVLYYGGAQGGSSLFKQNSSSAQYWWDEDTDAAGTMLQRLYDNLEIHEIVPTHLSWSQGEQDAVFLNQIGRQTEAEYKAKLRLMFEDVRNRYGDVQIYIKIIGRRTDGGNANTGGTQSVRNAQLELINELDYVHYAGDQYHVGLFDGVHPLDLGYEKIFAQEARFIALEGAFSPVPEIMEVTRNSNEITVMFDGVSDLQPQTNISGFTYIDSAGTEISILGASATNNIVTITLSTTPLDDNGVLYYIFDKADGLMLGNEIVDAGNGHVPLRSKKITGV